MKHVTETQRRRVFLWLVSEYRCRWMINVELVLIVEADILIFIQVTLERIIPLL